VKQVETLTDDNVICFFIIQLIQKNISIFVCFFSVLIVFYIYTINTLNITNTHYKNKIKFLQKNNQQNKISFYKNLET